MIHRKKLKRSPLPRNMTLREYIKAQVKADPLVIQDRRIIWEKFYKHLPKLLVCLVLSFCGCTPENVKHLDNAVVQDEHGRFYLLKHWNEDCFKVTPLTSNITFKAD